METCVLNRISLQWIRIECAIVYQLAWIAVCKACEKEYICESDLAEYNKFITPLACEGMVEKKQNPFFDIAKKMMNKGKGRGAGGGG